MTAQREPEPRRTGLSRHIPLGRYAGVPVNAHWSLLVILALLTQILATSTLPSALPGRHTAAYWLVGAAAAVIFLAALLAHELAHALAARRYGVPVKQITLWMLGGQTELGGEAPTPRAEAVTAGVGPATSLGLGGVFAGLAWLFGGSGLLGVALIWLAGVNLLLGVFNLLPGFPLDGGRLLRAALWRYQGDRVRATEGSARAGSVLGGILIALGVFTVLRGSVFGLWLALIGWFILASAGAERHAAGGHRLLGKVARDIMTTPPSTVPAWWTVAEFATRVGQGNPGQHAFVLVSFDGQPQSVLTLRDLARVPVQQREDARLRDIVRRRVPALVVAPDTPLAEIMLPIRLHGGVATVVEDGQPVGTLTLQDLDTAATLARIAPTADEPVPDTSDGPRTDGPQAGDRLLAPPGNRQV